MFIEGPMTHEALLQRYKALELATAGRLTTFNERIRGERKQKFPNDEKLAYLNGQRKEIMRQLNLIREAMAKEDLSVPAYNDIKKVYLDFSPV